MCKYVNYIETNCPLKVETSERRVIERKHSIEAIRQTTTAFAVVTFNEPTE